MSLKWCKVSGRGSKAQKINNNVFNGVLLLAFEMLTFFTSSVLIPNPILKTKLLQLKLSIAVVARALRSCSRQSHSWSATAAAGPFAKFLAAAELGAYTPALLLQCKKVE